MKRIQLRMYIDPGAAEAFVNIKRHDGQFHMLTAIVDTGAAVSVLPDHLRPDLQYRLSEQHTITIEQAGIADQTFEATEAFVTLFLEDQSGQRTPEFEAKVWFANTNTALLGFADILDRAILYLDLIQSRSGWLEMDI
jgi:hypothetical protein